MSSPSRITAKPIALAEKSNLLTSEEKVNTKNIWVGWVYWNQWFQNTNIEKKRWLCEKEVHGVCSRFCSSGEYCSDRREEITASTPRPVRLSINIHPMLTCVSFYVDNKSSSPLCIHKCRWNIWPFVVEVHLLGRPLSLFWNILQFGCCFLSLMSAKDYFLAHFLTLHQQAGCTSCTFSKVCQ